MTFQTPITVQQPLKVQPQQRTLDQIPKHERMYVVGMQGVQILDLLNHQVVGNPIPVGQYPISAVIPALEARFGKTKSARNG